MRHYFFLLVAVLLAVTDALPTTTEGNHLHRADLSISAIKTRRSLRLAKKSDAAEERATGGGLSSIKTEISKKIPLKVKLAWWQHFAGKPSEYVKNKLGPNHPLYLKYKDTRERNEMWVLASRSYSTYKIWKSEGLEGMISLRTDMTFRHITAQIKQLEGTEPFRVYKRYANKFDDHRLANFGSGYYRDTNFIDKEASAAEKYARAYIWAESKRDPVYVREFLGLLRAAPTEINKNPYYRYYLMMSDQ